jgi:hypothetical protein
MDGTCPHCHGERFTPNGENSSKQCLCAFWKEVGIRLGPEIGGARKIAATPLLVLGRVGGDVEVDRTIENLFIKGWWSDIISHLQIVLSCKMMNDNLRYPFKIVTDGEIFEVRMSMRAYNSRPRSRRDIDQIYNTLSDFMGPSEELVIIRLGSFAYRNSAVPGYLKEALIMRMVVGKATWIVEEPDSIFGPGHFSYNEDVGDYIANRFEPLDLTTTREGPIIPRGVEGSEVIRSGNGLAVDDDRPVSPQVVMPKARIVAPAPRMDVNDPLLFGNGKKPKNGKWGGNH